MSAQPEETLSQERKRKKRREIPEVSSFVNPASALPASRARMRELLFENSRVTSNQRGQEIEIQLGHFCNNRCVFCASGQLTEQGLAQPVAENQIFSALEEASKAGVQRVTFLGGEPTVQESFLPALGRATELGFQDIVIFTNGVRTGDSRFVDAIAKIGAFSWRFSIQGGDADSHDTAVGRPGAFKRLVAGLKHLQSLGHPVTSNMCLTSHAVQSLHRLPALLRDHDISQMCIDMVRPVSVGERDDAWMASMLPRFSDLAPAIDGMLERFQEIDPEFDINITHLPYCVLPKWGHKISHGGVPTLTFTADMNQEQGVVDKYEFQADDRSVLPKCEGCIFIPRCTGVPHDYTRIYGNEEIQAITREDLLSSGAHTNNLPLFLGEELQELTRLSPPQGWKLEAVDQEHRQRFAAFRWRHHERHQISFRVIPSELEIPSGWFEVMNTSDFKVVVQFDRDDPTRLHIELLDCFLAQAKEAFQEPSSAPSTPTFLKALRKTAQWLQRANHKVQYMERLGPWTIAGIDSFDHSLKLYLHHSTYEPIEILINKGTQTGAPPLNFQVMKGASVPEEILRSTSSALSQALRQA